MHAADTGGPVSTKAVASDPVVRVPRPRPSVWQRMVKYRLLYLLFVPVAAYFVIFQYWPIVLSFIVAFKDLKLGRHLDPQQRRLVISLPADVTALVTVPTEAGGPRTESITGPGRFSFS